MTAGIKRLTCRPMSQPAVWCSLVTCCTTPAIADSLPFEGYEQAAIVLVLSRHKHQLLHHCVSTCQKSWAGFAEVTWPSSWVQDLSFINNTAQFDGGAIFQSGTSSPLQVRFLYHLWATCEAHWSVSMLSQLSVCGMPQASSARGLTAVSFYGNLTLRNSRPQRWHAQYRTVHVHSFDSIHVLEQQNDI